MTWAAEAGRPISPVRPPADRADDVVQANLVICGGEAGWAFGGFDNPLQARRIVRIDTLPAAADARQEGSGTGYLDPAVADAAADEIAARLAALRPEREADFKANAAAVKAEIDAATLARPAGGDRPVLVYTDAFVPLLRWAGFAPVRVDAQPTDWDAAAVARTRQAAEASGARFAAVPADLTPAALAEFQRRTGVIPVRFDALGSSAAGGRGGIVALLKYDVGQLAELNRPEK